MYKFFWSAKSVLSLLFVFFICKGFAFETGVERFYRWSALLSPEKVYIHTDREVYNIGDTVWIKGYLRNASAAAEYPECNYLYVELSSAKWEPDYYKGYSEERVRMRQRVKIKRGRGGVFSGYLSLTEDLNTGIATLRAYSYWMLNGDPAYLFTKNLELHNPMKDEFVGGLKEMGYSDQLTYDELGVDNPFRKRLLRGARRSEADLDVQFLPEGGRYLPGRSAVLGVKAINPDGLGVRVSGTVFADGVPVAEFSTDALGLGWFKMTVPEGTKALTAVTETSVETFRFEVPVPLPEARGVMLHVEPDTSGVFITVSDAGLSLPDSTFLIVYDRTEIVLQSEYSGCEGGKRVLYSGLRPGINNAAVVDSGGNVYAERPFFVFPEGRIIGDIIFDKPSYGKREKVMAAVRLYDESGRPVNGDFSLAVTDDTYAPSSGECHTVESWMLLGSELQGLVEKPQRYFCDSVPLAGRIREVDALLLTQGWRYYDLEGILRNRTETPRFGKEYTQSLSGYVTGVLGRKSRRATLCFMAPKIGYTQIADIDSTAYFALGNLDFPDSTEFIVGAQGKGNFFRKWYAPILNPEYFAADHKYPDYLKFRGYTEEYGQYARQSYYAEEGSLVYTIAPARIVAQKPHVSPYPNDNFKPGQYRNERMMEPYRSYDLVTYIYTTCPGVHLRGGRLVGSSYIVSSEMQASTIYPSINIYLNGFRVDQTEIAGLMVSDVDALVYINGTNAAKYDTSFGTEGFTARKSPPVVMISTRFPNRTAYNVTRGGLLGWQRPARFYAPKYETAAAKTRFEPMRATLHWEPYLYVENGVARFTFYTSDHNVPYRIILEGLTDENRPVHINSTL